MLQPSLSGDVVVSDRDVCWTPGRATTYIATAPRSRHPTSEIAKHGGDDLMKVREANRKSFADTAKRDAGAAPGTTDG